MCKQSSEAATRTDNIETRSTSLTYSSGYPVTSSEPSRKRVDPILLNPLNTKRRLLYLKTQFVPRSKHFSSLL